MRRANSYRLPNGILYEVDDEQFHVATTFPDGTVATGVAQFEDDDEARARGLGYEGTRPDVCWAMHRDHDLLHHVVAQAQGWPYSMVLWAVAHQVEHPQGFGNVEERTVFLVTRALNLGGLLPEALL